MPQSANGLLLLISISELPYLLVRDVPFFGVRFFEQEINFGVSFSASPIMDPSLDIYFQHELNFRVYTLYGI